MTQSLEQAFGFTAEDLMYNQQGELSPEQQRALIQFGRRQKIALTLAAIAFGASGVMTLLPFVTAGAPLSANVGRLIGGTVFLLLGLLLLSGLTTRPDTRVRTAEGRLRVMARTAEILDNAGQVQTSPTYEMVVDGVPFPLRAAQIDALHEGHVYRVYHGAMPGRPILSLLYVGRPPDAP